MPTRDMPVEPLPALLVGTGPGLLLAHGAGGTPELNFPFIDDLARRYTVVAPYYPGTGPTRRAVEPLSIDDLADGLVASAVNAGLSSFAMLGYSLGAAITVRAATRHPGRVNALVLTAGFAHARPSLRSLAALWSDLLSADPGTLAHFLAFAGSGEAALSTLSPADYDRLIEILSNSSAPSGTPDQVDLVRRVDVRADLGSVAVPTLVVVTTADALVAPAHSAELIANIRGASSVEIDSGHLIAAERSAQWQRAVEGFLTTVHPGVLQRSEA
jgi:pimeloyl-ACP methyl ester carboxylesterase